MIATPTEFNIFKKMYGSPEIRSIFSEENYIKTMVDFEVALAKCQAELNMIPQWAADEIEKAGIENRICLKRVKEINEQTKLYTVAVVRALAEVTNKNAGEYIHSGATSQDIIETALALRVQSAFNLTEIKIKKIIKILHQKSLENSDTLTASRTHGQQALPTTFGFILAGYSNMLAINLEKIQEAKKRILVGSCSGAVGTMASFHALNAETAHELEEKTLQLLGLYTPTICQHPNIGKWSECLNLLAELSQSIEKIGEDLYTLQRTEIAEIEEFFDTENQICSSTMPQKRNPIYAEMLPPFAKKVMSNALAMNISHHREARHFTPLYMYDLLIPESFLLIDTMLEALTYIFSGITVKKENMLKNLKMSNGLIMSESLLFTLTKKTKKKETAMKIVHRIAMDCFEKSIPFNEYCINDKELNEHLSKEEIKEALDEKNYTGLNKKIIDQVIQNNSKILGDNYA